MSIRAILALVDGGAGSQGTLRTAVQLGRSFDAYTEVLHVKLDPETVIPVVAEGMSGAAVGQIVESTRQGAETRAAEAQRVFQEVALAESLPLVSLDSEPEGQHFAVAWRETTGREAPEISERGRLFDLIVIARPDPESGPGTAAALEAALFETGRPVVIAPPEPHGALRHVAVAWNATRESARAVWAARPFLTRAEKVSIITVVDSDPGANPADLARYLAHHGVSAETHLAKRSAAGLGDSLLDATKDCGADLLVMGGYGHSRLRELVLGGATRSVLQQAALPVLMTH